MNPLVKMVMEGKGVSPHIWKKPRQARHDLPGQVNYNYSQLKAEQVKSSDQMKQHLISKLENSGCYRTSSGPGR